MKTVTTDPEFKVLATGCFDVLHFGHFELLRKASEIARNYPYGFAPGTLTVGIDSDANYKRLKGRKPYHNERQREMMLRRIFGVDRVEVFNNCLAYLKKVEPSVWVKGGDYSLETLDPEERAFCEENSIVIAFIDHTGHSSTAIKTDRES